MNLLLPLHPGALCRGTLLSRPGESYSLVFHNVGPVNLIWDSTLNYAGVAPGYRQQVRDVEQLHSSCSAQTVYQARSVRTVLNLQMPIQGWRKGHHGEEESAF